MVKSGKDHQRARREERQRALDQAAANDIKGTEKDIDNLLADRGALIFTEDNKAIVVFSREEDAARFRRLVQLFRPDKLFSDEKKRLPEVYEVAFHVFEIDARYARSFFEQKRLERGVPQEQVLKKAAEMLGIKTLPPAEVMSRDVAAPKEVVQPAPAVEVPSTGDKPSTIVRKVKHFTAKKTCALETSAKYSLPECLKQIEDHAVAAEIFNRHTRQTHTHLYVKGATFAKELYASLLQENCIAGAPDKTQGLMQIGDLFEIRLNQRIAREALHVVPSERVGKFEVNGDMAPVQSGAAEILGVTTGAKIVFMAGGPSVG